MHTDQRLIGELLNRCRLLVQARDGVHMDPRPMQELDKYMAAAPTTILFPKAILELSASFTRPSSPRGSRVSTTEARRTTWGRTHDGHPAPAAVTDLQRPEEAA